MTNLARVKTNLGRVTGIVAIGALALAIAGCGDAVVDDVKTEDTILHNLKVERGEDVKAVECPSGVEVVPDETFECTVIYADGKKQVAKLTIVNEDADLTMTMPGLR